MEQIMFSLDGTLTYKREEVPYSVIKEILLMGRVKEIAEIIKSLPKNEAISKIKKVYGIGGSSFAVKYVLPDKDGRYTIWADYLTHATGYDTVGKGFKVEWVENKIEHSKELSWTYIYNTIKKLINNNEYKERQC